MPDEYGDVLLLRNYGLRPWEMDGTGYPTIGHVADMLACFQGEQMAENARKAEQQMNAELNGAGVNANPAAGFGPWPAAPPQPEPVA